MIHESYIGPNQPKLKEKVCTSRHSSLNFVCDVNSYMKEHFSVKLFNDACNIFHLLLLTLRKELDLDHSFNMALTIFLIYYTRVETLRPKFLVKVHRTSRLCVKCDMSC